MTETLLGDLHSIETFDGKKLVMNNQDIAFLVYGGYGAPSIDYQTRRGYKMHGAVEVDFTLSVRTITVVLWRKAACFRQEYWDNRLALHEFLRPNRGGPITFTLRTPNGNERALKVRAVPGLQFPLPPIDENSWQVEESIDFVAFDPVWFDPNVMDLEMSSTIDTDLVFPIDFPIVFGEDGLVFNESLTYPGTWKEYPTFTLNGPYRDVIITNVTTGVEFSLLLGIGADDTRIITLTPGNQSIVDGDGNNKFGELSVGSNLVDWNLRPDPETPDGIQDIRVIMHGGVLGVSSVTMTYYARYFAI